MATTDHADGSWKRRWKRSWPDRNARAAAWTTKESAASPITRPATRWSPPISKHADPVQKISIVPRGRAALGYTLQLPTDDKFLLTRAELVDRLNGLLGGRAAEELVFDEVSTGAENDLELATALARQMICLYGMSECRWAGALRAAAAHVLARRRRQPAQIDCSPQTARDIDAEVKKLLDAAYVEAKKILGQHREKLDTRGPES